MRRLAFAALIFTPLFAEVRTLTLREAVDLAQKQSPDLVIARLNEQRATLAIRVARDPFLPKLFAGSGLAYSNGFPMSIEGSAPSIIQARAVASIFNRPFSYRVAQITEEARAASLDTQMQRDNVSYQTALFYLDAARLQKAAESLATQARSLEQVETVVRARVSEGRELEIENKKAALSVALIRQQLESVELERDYAESSLAFVLGFPPTDRVKPAVEGSLGIPEPDTEEGSVRSALDQSKELRKLESAILAKGHEVRAHKAARLPSVDLVAQYGLFAKFNNYEDFFRKFQRHNGQIGVSFQIPILPSAAAAAQAAQAESEISRLRAQVMQVRNRITLDTQKGFREIKRAERGREVARLSLDVARDQVTLLLAQMEEGRASLKQLEEARSQEHARWLEFYDAQFALERAKLELLKHTGGLIAALQ